MAPRGKRAKIAATTPPASELIAALKFVAVAQHATGQIYQTHCALGGGTVVAFDGTIAAGQRINEDLTACPHTHRLIDALTKCGDSLAITQIDNGRLSVKSGNFRAFVPCVARDMLLAIQPDPPVAAIDDRLRTGFEIVGNLAADASEHVVTASILLQAGSMVATDRRVMIEYWHGIDLPPGIVLPKAGAAAVVKTKKPLVSFGFSENSATFYFNDGSWIKSQLYSVAWPNISRILDVSANPLPLPDNFYAAVDAVSPFSESDDLHFTDGFMRSHPVDGIGATYEIAGLPAGVVYKAKHLKLVQPYIKTVDFSGKNGIAYFFGDNIRGAITGVQP